MRTGTAETYWVFVRSWWKGSPTNRIPHPGARKTCIARRCTYEEARSIAQAYNATHEPGWQSRKAEFDSE